MIDRHSICRFTEWPHIRKFAAGFVAVAIAAGIAAARLGDHSPPTPRVLANKPTSRAWQMTDSLGDGTPDFLRLYSAADRDAFRRWFTFLAEVHFFRAPDRLPPDVKDCAALLRFAYRESLRRHHGEWATSLGLDIVPPAADLDAYSYPFTPLKASLFRIRPGRFSEADLSSGAFAEFADAETLMHRNTWRVSRDLAEARPGDLLFF